MFQPNYSLNPLILSNITQIDRFYGQLEGLRLPKKLELNLESKNLIQSSYVSNSIEGNPLSLLEVTNLLLGDRVAVNRDEKEIINYFNILSNLTFDKPLNFKTILEIHKDLMKGVEDNIAGQIRDKRIVVGKYVEKEGKVDVKVKHEPPFHSKLKIEIALEDLLQWLDSNDKMPISLKAGIFHHQFVYIHPFEDGNGRTCRLLTALIFLKSKYLINKYFVIDDYYDIDRLQYSDMLHTADLGDSTKWLEYFTDGVKFSMQSALEKAKNSLTTLNIQDRLSEREEEVLKIIQQRGEITSAMIATQLKVSRQQAHNILSALLDKGFIKKEGSTKSSYYKIT